MVAEGVTGIPWKLIMEIPGDGGSKTKVLCMGEYEYFLELHINCRAKDSKESLKDFKCNLSGDETTGYCIELKAKGKRTKKQNKQYQ